MRRGEIIGLKWEDVSFSEHRIHIKRARVRGRDTITKGGKRSRKPHYIPPSPTLEKLLQGMAASRPRREGAWSDPGYVFQSPRGKQWDERNFARVFARIRRVAAIEGVRPLKFHCTRHTFATLALEAGKTLKWVADALGHSNPTITLNMYTHVGQRSEGDMDFTPGTGRNQSATKACGGFAQLLEINGTPGGRKSNAFP